MSFLGLLGRILVMVLLSLMLGVCGNGEKDV